MTDVTLNIPARTPHLCSVLTGFILLEKQGKLRLKLNTNVKMPSASIKEAIITESVLLMTWRTVTISVTLPRLKDILTPAIFISNAAFPTS